MSNRPVARPAARPAAQPAEGRKVRPQAGTSATADAPEQQRATRATRPAASADASTPAPATRPVRGRAAGPAASSSTTTGTPRAERRPASAPAVTVAPLVVFGPRAAAAKDAFFGPMADVMTELHGVLHAEIAALDNGDTATLDILRHRKDGLAGIYLECLVNLRRDEALKSRLDVADREALRQAGEALRVATTENMRRLQARIDTVSDVINSVIEAARTGGDDSLKVYEQNGTVGGGQRPTSRLGLDTAL